MHLWFISGSPIENVATCTFSPNRRTSQYLNKWIQGKTEPNQMLNLMFSLVIVYKPDLCMFTEAAACSAVDMVTAGAAPAPVPQGGAERRATAAQVLTPSTFHSWAPT